MNRATISYAILVIAVLTLLGYILHKPATDTDINQLKTQMDSMIVHDRQRDTLYSHMQTIHTQDSIRIDDIEDQLNSTQGRINNINNAYNQKRTQLATAPIDDKLRFLSGHLPKSGNSR